MRDIGWCLRVLRGDPLGARIDRRRVERGENGWPLAVINEDVFWSSAAKMEDEWVDR